MEGGRDDLSSVSFVSTISAASSVHHPKPPDRPKPSSQRFHSKTSGKVVRSPYLVTSTPYPNKKKQKRSSDNEGGSEGRSQVIREQWAKAAKRVPHSSASSFLQSLMLTGGFSTVLTGSTVNKRKRTHSTSGTPKTKRERTKHNSVSSSAAPLTTDSGQLDAIALRDETVRLKQLLNSVMAERDLAKAQLGKVQAEVGRKDKQIEDLLAAGHVPSRDTTRTLVGSRKAGSPATHSALSSLRVRIHSLEQALREKEKELAALRSDVSVTKMREMEIQTETYYREICRLSSLLSEREGGSAGQSGRDAQIKLKALNKATVKMAAQLEELEQQNAQLLSKLQAYEGNGRPGPEVVTHNEKGLRGSIADKYVDYKRSQFLSAIVDLELRLREKESSVKSLVSDMESKKAHYERRIGELTGAQNDSNTQIKALQAKVTELESTRDKLHNVVRKLKDDRTHYRTVAENTQESLASVQECLESEKMNRSAVIQELESLRDKHQNEMTAIEHARKLASRRSRVFTPEKERQQEAASTLQHHWKRRQAGIKQRRFEGERDQAVLDLQSTLRGHLARKQMVQGSKVNYEEMKWPNLEEDSALSEDSDSDPSGSSDAVETIQAAMRGYMARQMAMRDLVRSESTSPSVGDMWRDSDQVDGGGVSHLTGYHPPQIRSPETTEPGSHSKQSITKKKGYAHSSGPWSNKLAEESSDEDSPHLLRTTSLHLDHSLSSSNDNEGTHVDSGEHALLRDEL